MSDVVKVYEPGTLSLDKITHVHPKGMCVNASLEARLYAARMMFEQAREIENLRTALRFASK